jgi:hypothetical protein
MSVAMTDIMGSVGGGSDISDLPCTPPETFASGVVQGLNPLIGMYALSVLKNQTDWSDTVLRPDGKTCPDPYPRAYVVGQVVPIASAAIVLLFWLFGGKR